MNPGIDIRTSQLFWEKNKVGVIYFVLGQVPFSPVHYACAYANITILPHWKLMYLWSDKDGCSSSRWCPTFPWLAVVCQHHMEDRLRQQWQWAHLPPSPSKVVSEIVGSDTTPSPCWGFVLRSLMNLKAPCVYPLFSSAWFAALGLDVSSVL
jgi:hypothetical protein